MKKLISIILAAMFALTVSVTAFAAEGAATPDTPDFELQVKEAVVKKYYESQYPYMTDEDIFVFRSVALSDGGFYFSFWVSGIAHPDVLVEDTIGNFYYNHNAGDEVYIYKNGEVLEIKEAYEIGIINDDILEELSDMYIFGIEPINDAPESTEYEFPTQPQIVKPETIEEPTTQPQMINSEATSAAKVVSSSSAATIDTPANVGLNGAVQTGQNDFAILTLLIVITLAGVTVIFSKYAYRK